MGPIEVLWGVVVVIFVMVSMARGYQKELGSTALILAALVALKLMEKPLTVAITTVFRGNSQNLVLMLAFQLVFIMIVYAGYSGETLVFKGQPRRGSSAVFFNIVFGLLNGILVAGTLWYYMAINKYPLPQSMLDATKLSEFAKKAPTYLPPTLPVTALVALLLFLIIMRVRK